ncbi:MAG: TonB-dependent receptor [Gemmatimonadaceae bacterium]|nr:TonB-dependent receptor [Gemmatimonadaceae bacterium]
MITRVNVRRWRSSWLAAAISISLPTAANAQSVPPSRRDSSQRADTGQRIERVLVSAIRAGDTAPISQSTIGRDVIAPRHFGQDVPLLLQGASPSLTAHTETGTPWGYSYLRLRGLDQTRINITIDGIPLNDMEDQVLYFANFADLMASVQTVQVQRGVGTSTAGTASFAGSVNFETMPVALKDAGGDISLQLGSFGAQRASVSFRSGLTDSRFAVYGRASALRTNGYRDHSGVMGRTGFVGAGWFGARTIVKATALVGLLADTLSYTGATRAELDANRRYNPLAPDELDKFGQQLLALSVSHVLSDAATVSSTVYRNSASGHYDYFYDADRYRYGLAHTWYGTTSAVNVEHGDWHLNLGVNANTYARAHRAFLRPDLTAALYDNTGHKQDASAFAKASLDQGRVRWFADLQTRWMRFRYTPDVRAGVDARSIDWTFFNPKAGATVRLGGAWSAFASYGVTTREPARSDLLAGDDDLNAGNVADYGDFSRVKPESVRDAEAGVKWLADGRSLQANVYSMDFRNDIARIGAPTASGSVLRRNVGASYRRGVEVDGRWTIAPRVVVAGNAAWSANRIRSFTDSSRGTPVVRRHVEPLLTPRYMSAHRVELSASRVWTVTAEGRYQSRAFLDNTSSVDRVLPDFYVLDATARAEWGRYAVTVRGANLGNTQKFGSGSVSGTGTVRYFVLPVRAVFATVDVKF